MDKYELVVIVDAMLPLQEKENVLKDICDMVTKNGGKVINNQVWIDRHKFPFRIKKSSEGTYYLVNFESQRSAIIKMKQLLKINEKVLRFLILNVS